jgi:hypothetical protein
VVSLLTERQPQVVVTQGTTFGHLREEFRGHLHGLAFAVSDVLLEREVGLGAGEGRIQANRMPRRSASLFVPCEVPIHERDQILCVCILRVKRDCTLEGLECLAIEPAVVKTLAKVEQHDAALGFECTSLLKPLRRGVKVTSLLFSQSELYDGCQIFPISSNERLELLNRSVVLSDRGIGPRKLPASVTVIGRDPQPFLQLCDTVIEVTGLPIRDLEIALRYQHLRI